MKNNVISTDEFKAADKLNQLTSWMEDNRHHFRAIIERPAGSPCRATVLQAVRDLQYEVYQCLLYLSK